MSDTMPLRMTESATRLADILAQENAALRAMNLPEAMALLAAKAAALEAIGSSAASERPAPASRPAALALVARLRGLMAENRELLEIAMQAQGRVISLVARAAAQQARRAPFSYGNGGGAIAHRPAAIAISARA